LIDTRIGEKIVDTGLENGKRIVEKCIGTNRLGKRKVDLSTIGQIKDQLIYQESGTISIGEKNS